MSVFRLGEFVPRLGKEVWIADTARVIGHVELGDHVSVWYGATIRGDHDRPIRVGAYSNIQDGSVLHLDDGIPLTIGERVTVGHMVMLHGCTIGDNSLIGIGSIILNRAVIGKNSLVGAHTLITEGKTFPDGVMILGNPGKVVRELSAEEIAGLAHNHEHYVHNSQRYQRELAPATADELPAAATR